MSTMSVRNEVAATIKVASNEGNLRSIELRTGDRLVVGSDSSSDILINAAGVAATHCMISAEGGVVSLQDCYSDAGTFVNGTRVRQTELRANSEVRVGTATISVTVNNANTPASQTAESSNKTGPAVGPETAIRSLDAVSECTTQNRIQEPSPFQQIEELQAQLDQANAEVNVLQTRLQSAGATAEPSVADPYQEEMIELLRAEVIDLQTALAERDQCATETIDAARSDNADDDVLPRADAERLVERLEQLLTELQERDEQIVTLTGLLEVAEEAARAQQEEQVQLNTWLQDIEERFGSREQEWLAQRTSLEQNIETLIIERDRAERAMSADTTSAKLEAAQQVMTGLRATAESQRQQLKDSETVIVQLRQEIEQAKHSEEKQALVQLAEQRAEIARQRQELELARQKFRNGPSDATLKLQALRQHLNEIHVREQEEKQKEMQERKLSSRLARLWNRMDGR